MNPKALNGSLWMVEENRLRQMLAMLAAFTAPTGSQLAAEKEKRMALVGEYARAAKRVAVVPITGVIQKTLDAMCWFFGGSSTEELSYAMDILAESPEVDTILLKIDSPGGATYGVEELSEKIYSLRAKKQIVAIADPVACSAAYYLGTAAEKLYCIPSGDVGSVGVYRIHVDESKALADDGINVTVFSAGDYKAETMPFRPLSEEAKAFLQADVERIYAKFLADVGRNRGISAEKVKENYGKGRPISGPDALKAGMIDGLTTFERLFSSLSQPQKWATGTAKLQHAQAKREKEKEKVRAELIKCANGIDNGN